MKKEVPHIGKVLRNYRKGKGYTLKDMGRFIGLSYQQYQRYELGDTPPPFDRLEILIKILEIPPEKLFVKPKVKDFYEQFEAKIKKYRKILDILENDSKLLKMIKAYGKSSR